MKTLLLAGTGLLLSLCVHAQSVVTTITGEWKIVETYGVEEHDSSVCINCCNRVVKIRKSSLKINAQDCLLESFPKFQAWNERELNVDSAKEAYAIRIAEYIFDRNEVDTVHVLRSNYIRKNDAGATSEWLGEGVCHIIIINRNKIIFSYGGWLFTMIRLK